ELHAVGQVTHRLPHLHHLRHLMSGMGRALVLPLHHLDEDGLALARRRLPDLRRRFRAEPGLAQGRAMLRQDLLELVLLALLHPIDAEDIDRTRLVLVHHVCAASLARRLISVVAKSCQVGGRAYPVRRTRSTITVCWTFAPLTRTRKSPSHS